MRPPYRMIWDDLQRGRIVPFLGAGASVAARSDDRAWNPDEQAFPPSASELAAYLASYASYPAHEPTDDLAKVASYMALIGGRARLRDCLRQVFIPDFSPGPVHRLLASIEAPLLIVTTNYDRLLERAFEEQARRFHVVQWTDDPRHAGSVVWWPSDGSAPRPFPPKRLPLTPGSETIIYKMHGSADPREDRWTGFLITEEDYVDFLASMTRQAAIPVTFKHHFQQSSFLFLGYGLGDWNLRVLLRDMKLQRSTNGEFRPSVIVTDDDVRSWAIQYQPSALESALWRTRAVDIFDVELNRFVNALWTACVSTRSNQGRVEPAGGSHGPEQRG